MPVPQQRMPFSQRRWSQRAQPLRRLGRNRPILWNLCRNLGRECPASSKCFLMVFFELISAVVGSKCDHVKILPIIHYFVFFLIHALPEVDASRKGRARPRESPRRGEAFPPPIARRRPPVDNNDRPAQFGCQEFALQLHPCRASRHLPQKQPANFCLSTGGELCNFHSRIFR